MKITPLLENAPPDPDIEDWIMKNKSRFMKKYGKSKGKDILYGLAWKRYNKK